MKRSNPLQIIILVFVLLNGMFVIGGKKLERWDADQSVLILGNLMLFGVTFISFILTRKSFANPNPNAFVRAIYKSFMVKFFVCAGVAFAYIMSTGKEVNKPALFFCMGLYVMYTALEVAALTKMLRAKKNA